MIFIPAVFFNEHVLLKQHKRKDRGSVGKDHSLGVGDSDVYLCKVRVFSHDV